VLENGSEVPGGGFINGLTRAEGVTAAGEILAAGWVWDGVDLNHKVFLFGGSGSGASGGQIVIEAGEPAPGGGAWSDFEPVVNGLGELAFHGVVDFSAFGSWRREGSGDSILALPGGAAPIPGGTWSSQIDVGALSDSGAALFYAVASVGGGSRDGFFIDVAGTTVVAALNGDPAPGGGTFAGIASKRGALVDDDSAVFYAQVIGGATTSGLFRSDGGVITSLLVQGDAVPTPRGGTVDGIRTWMDANASGSVVFVAEIVREGNPAWPAVFIREANGTFHEILYLGDPVPGSAGRHFSGAWDLAINASGNLAFTAPLQEPPWSGLFVWDGAKIVPVVLVDTPVPGLGGREFYQFGNRLEIDSGGRVIFDAGSTDLGAWGVFAATQVEEVPVLPRMGRLLLPLTLVSAGLLMLRHSRRSESRRP
jgi:hypothetical protein